MCVCVCVCVCFIFYLSWWFPGSGNAFEFDFPILGCDKPISLDNFGRLWRHKHCQMSETTPNPGLAMRTRPYLALVTGVVVQHHRENLQGKITCKGKQATYERSLQGQRLQISQLMNRILKFGRGKPTLVAQSSKLYSNYM